ncbi:hypothetical protein F5148DRAFT_189808 [Russula earlei]|uniref:Uncharacterized protein n=1 Tax=Russula earlei TaxID=71964 RepID=A0ACC0U6U9_9AGAM|nr:hypothetical protein F5148DRAFT_189808 [Russula earlei]
MTATTLPISTSVAATSSSTIAPAADFATNSHGAPFWAGIALLGIACVATIITLLVWWLRVRKPTHRRPWESPWRWGRAESYKFPEDAITSGTSASWWKPQRDGGESGLSTSNLLSSRGMSNRELQLPVAAAIPFMHGPYPTVRPLPLELRHTDTSVPGLVQDVGSLHVANLVPGDILTSGDESSRPPTALDDIGTPREIGAMYKPRYLSLNGSGLDVPWIQTPPAEPTPVPVLAEPVSTPPFMGGTAPLNHNRWKERLERSSAMPTQSQEPPPSSTIEAWRESLRINLANALNVFTSTAPPPPVSSSRPSVTAYNWNHGAPAVARAPSIASTSSKPWTLEETCDGAGIVHIRGVPNPFAACSSSHSSIPSSSHSSRSRALPPTPSSSCLRPPPPPRASLVPPRLPHLPPMPAVPRTSVGRSTSTKPQHGSRSRRRASFVRRSSSSAASEATSVGSDMSRAGSGSTAVARWARLSEKEEAARRALRQRHRRSIRCARKRTHVSNELRE